MLRMESPLENLIGQKVMNKFKKENRESDKDLHPFEYNFERGQLQLQYSRLLFTDRSDDTKDIPLKTFYPKVYSIFKQRE